MNPTDPIPWRAVEAAHGPPSSDYLETFDAARDGFERERERDTPRTVVHERLYNRWKSAHDADRRTPDQGVAYVLAYLLEREGVVDEPVLSGGVTPPSLLERRPDEATLRRLFHDDLLTGWQLGIRYGVHYSLVQHWLWEVDVPLLRRNFTDESFAALEGMLD